MSGAVALTATVSTLLTLSMDSAVMPVLLALITGGSALLTNNLLADDASGIPWHQPRHHPSRASHIRREPSPVLESDHLRLRRADRDSAAAIDDRERLAGSTATLGANFPQTFLKTVLIGYVVGCSAEFLTAIAIHRSPFLQKGLVPIGNLVAAFPIIGTAPIMVMWFGFNWPSKRFTPQWKVSSGRCVRRSPRRGRDHAASS